SPDGADGHGAAHKTIGPMRLIGEGPNPISPIGPISPIRQSNYQLPRCPILPPEHVVRLLVVDELVRLRIPLQALAGLQRDHADVADDYRPATDLGVADRLLLPVADAFEEVAHLVSRPARVELRVLLERLGEQLRVARH